MLRVGLTGGIACGKSHVLRRLASRGLAVLDLDPVAHAVMAPGGAAYEGVVAEFGSGILRADGTIDRVRLGGVVFADPAARARLDALVHPVVRQREAEQVAALGREGHDVVVTDAALLIEAGAHLRFERLVVVACESGEQLSRLMRRDGLAEPAARARIAAQLPTSDKRRLAHSVIDTSGTPEDTDRKADDLAGQLRALAAQPQPEVRVPEDAIAAALRCAGGEGPRGLSPAGLLQDGLEEGGLELRRLTMRLRPPVDGPWYRAARPGEGGPWPETLAVPLALLAAHGGHDREWLCLAAASVSRLTHVEGETVAGAVLAAMVAYAVARGEGPATLPERLHGWAAEAMRWGDALPAARVERAVDAAARATGSCEEARRRARRTGSEAAFAAALVGLASGRGGPPANPQLVQLARRLGKGRQGSPEANS